MNRMHHRVLLALAALAASAGGCGDRTVVEPVVPAGRIEGFVRMAVNPVHAKVRATLVTDSPGEAARFEAQASQGGFYTMDIPAGRYVLGVLLRDDYNVDYEYSAAGLSAGDTPSDTLRVDASHSPLAVNFDLASIRFHLQVSPDLDGETANLVLHRLDAAPGPGLRTSLFTRSMTIQNGAVDELLTAVLPGTYKLEMVLAPESYPCDCPYDGEHFWMPGVREAAQSPAVEIAANHLVAVDGGVSPAPAHLQGRISGPWQQLGLPVPLVSVFALDSSVVRSVQPAGPDGSFDAILYVPGAVKLLVTHEGVRQWIGGSSFAAATVFVPGPGETIAGIPFVESAARVEAAPASVYLPSLMLRLYDATTLVPVATWNPPRGGLFVMPNLRPGTYRLRIDPVECGYLPWVGQWYDRVENPMDARTITIGSEGDVVDIPLVMQAGAVISGRVHDAAGQPLYARICVTSADAETVWGSGFFAFQFDGSFRIRGVPNGRWKIGASRTGGVVIIGAGDGAAGPVGVPVAALTPPADSVWHPGTTDWQFARAVTVRDSRDVSGVDIVMPQLHP